MIHETKPTMIMLIGVPGVGKSTWRNKFIDYHGHEKMSVISTDDYIDAVAKQKNTTYSNVFQDEIKNAENAMNISLDACLSLNRNIIIDRTNTTVKSRKKILSKIPNTYHKVAIWFSIPDDLESRLFRRQGKVIPKNVMDSMMENIEEPSFDEGFDVIHWHYDN